MPRSKDTRAGTLYDAIVGRIDYEGLINQRVSKANQASAEANPQTKAPKLGRPLHPDEVLFKNPKAPARYEEDDPYEADRWLGAGQRLPDSDLLKAIHTYASDLYSRGTDNGGMTDFRSLDETALIACGILLEEASREVLGETGDLALTEADTDGIFAGEYGSSNDRIIRPIPKGTETKGGGGVFPSLRGKKRKRAPIHEIDADSQVAT